MSNISVPFIHGGCKGNFKEPYIFMPATPSVLLLLRYLYKILVYTFQYQAQMPLSWQMIQHMIMWNLNMLHHTSYDIYLHIAFCCISVFNRLKCSIMRYKPQCYTQTHIYIYVCIFLYFYVYIYTKMLNVLHIIAKKKKVLDFLHSS